MSNIADENKSEEIIDRDTFEPRKSGNSAEKTAADYWGEAETGSEDTSSEKNRTEESRSADETPAAEETKAKTRREPTKEPFVTRSASVQIIKGSGTSHSKSRIVVPMAIWFVFVALVAFFLPKLPVFSHVVGTKDSDRSSLSSDSDKDGLAFYMGDEGEKVTSLQKDLYALGFMTFDEISGKYDRTTHEAVNEAMEEKGVNEIIGCSQESCSAIAQMAAEAKSAGTTQSTALSQTTTVPTTTETSATTTETTATTTETTTAATTATTAATETADTTTSAAETTTTTPASTEGKVKMVRITAKTWTKLRRIADPRGEAMFNLNNGEEYEVLEETIGSDGKVWYRIKFFYNEYNWRSGWALSDYVEVFYADA